jgi:hypothetical protein
MKQRGNRYSTAYVTRARELYGAGWTNCADLSRKLEGELGRAPSPTTIRKWCDLDYAESVRIRERRGGRPGPNRFKTWKLRLERIRELRNLGLSCEAIAKVVAHDFSLSLDGGAVERMLRGEMQEPTIARLLWPKGTRA